MRTWINLSVGLFAFSCSLLLSGAVYAQNYSFPLIECEKKGGCYVTAYYDLNRSSGSIRDWNCKSKTYDQHSGTDYGIGSFDGMDSNGSRPAVAAADGTVVAVSDGAYDRNTSSTYSSYCGTSTSCGNYVKLKHADGKQTIYCHMKKGSVKVSNGQNVKCGQELGRVGSSGCSTGPHLHFGVYPSGSTDDPYAATSGCGGSVSYWVSQGGYLGLPDYTCCNPNCSGKACGDDGCGGLCGTCSGQSVCENNQCVCKPNCSGKACGDDGCGGLCGSCTGQNVCEGNQCVCKPACDGKQCGDDGCGGLCGSCTGQDVCEGNQCVCKPACDGKQCGDDGCGGSCGDCTGAQDICENNQCVCQPACSDKQCGDDGCGGSCGECEEGTICEANVCVCVPNCDGKTCGDDGCGGSCGECPEQHHCDDAAGTCVCDPYCDGFDCGDDGCGGTCGSCEKGYGCQEHLCVENACAPDCTDKKCGDDGCGGTCGSCDEGYGCKDYQCVKDGCTPDCEKKQCGDDGCGGLCGKCASGEICENSQCKDAFGGVDPSINLMMSEEGCGCSQIQEKRQIPAWPLLLGILSLLSLLGLRRHHRE